MRIKQYEFPEKMGDNYEIFPSELENNEFIYFHGTSEQAFNSIKNEGFKIMNPLELTSVSFFERSSYALKYAVSKRLPKNNGVVIVVKFSDLKQGIRRDGQLLHLDDLKCQPEIIGYCLIPPSYDYS